MPAESITPAPGPWVVLGRPGATQAGAALPPAARHYPDIARLRAAVDTGAAVPALVVWPLPPAPAGPGVAEAAYEVTAEILAALRDWLADGRFAASRLVLVTQGAVAALPGDRVPNLAHAPLWGLVRAVQAEHPERLILLDLDAGAGAWAQAVRAIGLAGEPQLAIRNGAVLTPRLHRAEEPEPDASSPA
ncbi:SpnB-like Rossmann fold domain-containing protein [Thermocatellispora tengchongensis]|uniref:SpnB-like Rossmann fold domain-containing protein n=1 Tax=Thermocatellispora tengchongensis TaxID=1073253 RepID=UPI00362DC7A6